MYVFMKHFMNKLVFGWSERGVRLQSPPFIPQTNPPTPTRARPSCARAAGGSVKRGFSLSAGDFLSSQSDGGCCSLVSRRKRRDRGWRGRETQRKSGGGCCIAQQHIKEGGLRGSWWIYPPPPPPPPRAASRCY